MIAWWDANYDLYTDDTARRTAYYASPEHHLLGREVVLLGRALRVRPGPGGGLWRTTPTTTAHNTCEEIQARDRRAARRGPGMQRRASRSSRPGTAVRLPHAANCGFGKGKKDGPTPPPQPFWILWLSSCRVARPRGAGRRRLRIRESAVRHCGRELIIVLLAVFNLCGDAAMSILIKRKLSNTMWLVCVGVICAPLGVHVIAILDAWLYRADLTKLTKCNKAVVALALFFSLPALDGLALALPWPDRAHEGFPTARYSKASLVRAAQDAVMLLLKLVFYQAYAGFSALAMVLSVFSLVSLVLHARRAQKIWPEIFVRNRNRDARSDTEMTRAVAVPEVPMATDVPAGDVPLPAVPKSPPAPAPTPPPALSSWEDQSFAGDVAAPPPPAPPAPAGGAAARASAGAAAGRQAGAAPGWRPPPRRRARAAGRATPTPAGRVCARRGRLRPVGGPASIACAAGDRVTVTTEDDGLGWVEVVREPTAPRGSVPLSYLTAARFVYSRFRKPVPWARPARQARRPRSPLPTRLLLTRTRAA